MSPVGTGLLRGPRFNAGTVAFDDVSLVIEP